MFRKPVIGWRKGKVNLIVQHSRLLAAHESCAASLGNNHDSDNYYITGNVTACFCKMWTFQQSCSVAEKRTQRRLKWTRSVTRRTSGSFSVMMYPIYVFIEKRNTKRIRKGRGRDAYTKAGQTVLRDKKIDSTDLRKGKKKFKQKASYQGS